MYLLLLSLMMLNLNVYLIGGVCRHSAISVIMRRAKLEAAAFFSWFSVTKKTANVSIIFHLRVSAKSVHPLPLSLGVYIIPPPVDDVAAVASC